MEVWSDRLNPARNAGDSAAALARRHDEAASLCATGDVTATGEKLQSTVTEL